jgi:SAM-dependent methyltransferase
MISLVTWTLNEAATLPRMVESFAGLYDDLVVLDSGSGDGTQDVARGLGAKVFDYADPEHRCPCHPVMDWARMQNEAAAHAAGPVVMALDADLLLTGEDGRPLAPSERNVLRQRLEACAEAPHGRGTLAITVLDHYPDFDTSAPPICDRRAVLAYRPADDGTWQGRARPVLSDGSRWQHTDPWPYAALHHHLHRGDEAGRGRARREYLLALACYGGTAGELEWNMLHWPADDMIYAAPYQQARVAALVAMCNGSVLEVGCGTGYIARRIVQAGHAVTGLDASLIAVERARIAGVEAVEGWAENIPFDDHSFDTVLLADVLEHLVDPGRALSEACRVARALVLASLPTFPPHAADPMHRWIADSFVITGAQVHPVGEFVLLALRPKP